MIDVRLIELALADLEALSELHGRCFDARWSASSLSLLLATPGCFGGFVGAEYEPDGFVLARVAADEVEVLTLAVHPERRRRGIGNALVGFAARHAAILGAATMFLEVGSSNASARALYAARGFFHIGERPGYYASGSRPPEDALILRASLPLEPLGKRRGVG